MDDVDHLYAEIGKALSKSAMGMEPDQEDYEERGRSWFEKNQQKLSTHICCEEVRGRLDADTDEEKLVLIVADALGALVLYVPVASVARLVVRLGVYQFCGWHKES